VGFLSFAVPVLAAAFLVLGDFMQARASIPRFDLFLASATATPAAAHVAAGLGAGAKPVSLFTAPLVEFMFHGQPVFLTIPDCLALIASAMMIARFVVWVLSPLRNGGDDA
jgi:hypothetical protein